MSERDPRSEMAPHPFILREEFSLPEGPVTLLFPSPLSAESAAEVKEWLSLVERKVTRWAATSAPPRPCDVYHSVMHSHPVRCRLPLDHQQEQHEAMVDGKVLRWP